MAIRRIAGVGSSVGLSAQTAWAPTVIDSSHHVTHSALPAWLRRLTRTGTGPSDTTAQESGLEDIKKQISGLLASHVIGMPHHDMRVYLRVLCASDMSAIQEARFDLFDMLCRYHGEAVALQRLRDIDRQIG